MKFLIAGLGSIGRRHLRNLTALGERDILLYRTGRGTQADGELLGFPVETDLRAALKQRPDAVIVSNPTALHLAVAVPAAEAGCHILLEKPISHTLAGVADLRAAQRRGGGQLLVGFQYRFHPCLQEIARWLQAGAIGRPLSARAHYGDYLPGWHPWEDYRKGYAARADLGGGVVLTLCHPLDILGWLLGDAEVAWAWLGQVGDLEIEVEDTAEIGLRFGSRAVGSAHLDFYQRPPAVSLEISGAEGTVQWNQADNAARLFRVSAGKWETFAAPPGFERNDLFLAEMRHFLEVARGQARPACTLDDGERVLRQALAAHELAGTRGFVPLAETRQFAAQPVRMPQALAEPPILPGGSASGTTEAGVRRPWPKQVQRVVFDFDGVMTDNCVWVDQTGRESVAANRSDGMGLGLLRRQTAIEALVISTEPNPVVTARCSKLKLRVWQGVDDKAALLSRLLREENVDPAQVVYVGNDVNDLPCFPLVGFAAAPADAHPEVLGRADLVLKYRGGHGAVREVCDLLMARNRSGK